MTDPLDPDADLAADLRSLHQRASHPNDDKCWICHHPYPCPTLRLCDEVDRLRAEAVPDGHTRIDGKLFRLERHGDLNRYGLVRVRPEENPDV